LNYPLRVSIHLAASAEWVEYEDPPLSNVLLS